MDKIFELIEKESVRQAKTIGLIPSENFASKAVREAVGSVMANKYSEGQAGKRYYQGNAVIDEVERLCKERALKAFGLDGEEWGVNVQALSGSTANLAVYNALLKPGSKIMAMHLPDGGHLSHGWQTDSKKISFTSKIWKFRHYYVSKKTKVFDYQELQEEVMAYRPKLIVSGGTAYPREIDHKRMKQMAEMVNAYYLADVAHEAGLIVGGVNESPFPHADVVTTTTQKTLRGPRGAMIFSRQDLANQIDQSVFPGLQGGPHNEKIAGLAVALSEAMDPKFKTYTKRVVSNAQLLAEKLDEFGYDVVTGGTDKHLVLVDLRGQKLSGWTVAWALEAAGIVTNRNTVPDETASPFYPSGLRLGTPMITTRGMGKSEVKKIAKWIDRVVTLVADKQMPEEKEKRKAFTENFLRDVWEIEELKQIRGEVEELCGKFPLEN